MILRRCLPVVAAVVLAAAPARAHSVLLDATPAPGTRLGAAPARLVLRFNNRIEKKLSGARLIGARGEAHALVTSAEGGPQELVAPLPVLAAGAWRLEWRVLSTDGHLVTGAYRFEIGPAR